LVYVFATEVGGLAVKVGIDGEPYSFFLPQLTDDALSFHLRKYFLAYAHQGERHNDWLVALDEILRWLWDAAMGSITEALAPSLEAVLIPVGPLGLLPMHAAWTTQSAVSTGRRYACDAISFRYVPSARTLNTLRKRAPVTSLEILAVDDPRPVSASSLPNSGREVADALSYFSAGKVLAHEYATHQAVLLELKRYSVLHFSCHASPDFNKPLDGGLILAEDETLTLRELLNVRLEGVQLAVLSACATGVVESELPDEALGLPGALLLAGAGGVVASLWFVSEYSTMMLMTRFYEYWRGRDMAPVTALRAAQQWVRDTTNSEKLLVISQLFPEVVNRMAPETADSLYKVMGLRDPNARDFAHPFHWAAFTYTGA
jgi:CHAT domain-containing protein